MRKMKDSGIEWIGMIPVLRFRSQMFSRFSVPLRLCVKRYSKHRGTETQSGMEVLAAKLPDFLIS